ncbi:serine/alanine adding enzyme [Pilibacter termitis]|uniref:Serine/alanine adding enzyme n=1 Tax=Pilibacter termitis TaxID=263852 RepID=A0A1T4L682_9ENTE|nr:aminoacyltransferase [Pilibacter termitis]SJZ50090.1 serine/alanine adding enzyme [Pilibacter termitis]
MYIFKIGIPAVEHDKFIKENPLGTLLQSSKWAEVKENWKSEILGVYKENKLVASSLVLIKPLPLGFTMLYTPRGPVMDFENRELVSFFLKSLRGYAKRQRALFVKMDPVILYRNFFLGDDQVINGDAARKIALLKSTGAKWQGLTLDMSETIQPRFQANVHKESFSEEILSKKTRQMLRTARNKGIRVRIAETSELSEFVRLMNLTEDRKGVKLRSGDNGGYYAKLLDLYGEDAFLMLAELNLKELLEQSVTRLKENEEEISKLKPNQEKKRHNLKEQHTSLLRDVNELEEKVNTLGEVVNIAGTLSIRFGKTSEILYAGMDDNFKRYMPAYLTWFETIQECFRRGANASNMGGLDGSLNDGLLKFKKSFHPVIEEFAGEFDLPVNLPLFKLSEWAYKLKKRKKI